MFKFKFRIRSLLILTVAVAVCTQPAMDALTRWLDSRKQSAKIAIATVPDGGTVIIGGIKFSSRSRSLEHSIDNRLKAHTRTRYSANDRKNTIVFVTPSIIIQDEPETLEFGLRGLNSGESSYVNGLAQRQGDG